ncbi:hypothetical protein WJX74_000910 [Apatococcus lobatus]
MSKRVVFLEEIEEAAWPFVSCSLGTLLFLKFLDLQKQDKDSWVSASSRAGQYCKPETHHQLKGRPGNARDEAGSVRRVCLDVLGTSGRPATLPCGHNGCKGCLIQAQQMVEHCPVCRAPCLGIRLAVNLGLEKMLATMKMLAQDSPSGSRALAAASSQAEQSLQAVRETRSKALTHMLVVVCTLKDMKRYIDAGGRSELIDPFQEEGLCLPQTMSCAQLKALACSSSVQHPNYAQLRFWGTRENRTFRPSRVVWEADPDLRLAAYASKDGQFRCPKTGMSKRVVFLEEVEEAACPFVSCSLGTLLFLKFLDLQKQEIKMIGCLQAPKRANFASLKPIISSKAGLAMDGMKLVLLEEVKPNMCDILPNNSTLREAQLEDGDILIALCLRASDHIPQ